MIILNGAQEEPASHLPQLSSLYLMPFNIESHPVLADRHCRSYPLRPDSAGDDGLFLLDPGYLMCFPIKLPSLEPVCVNNGFNTIELIPLEGGQRSSFTPQSRETAGSD